MTILPIPSYIAKLSVLMGLVDPCSKTVFRFVSPAYYRAMVWMWTGIAATSLATWSPLLLCCSGACKVIERWNRIYRSPAAVGVPHRVSTWKARNFALKV